MAGLRWSFRVFGETLVVHPPAGKPDEGAHALPPIEAAWAIETLPTTTPGRDALVRRDLAMALEAVDGSSGRAIELPLDELRAAVADAIRDGKLVAERTTRPMRVQRPEKLEPLGPGEIPKETSWIAVQLVDDQDAPLAGQRCIITLPDRTTRDEVTDAAGTIKLSDVDPGNCKITFPDLDEREWGRA